MLTKDAAVAVWGEDNICRLTRDALEDIRISDVSKEFLHEVGLPNRVEALGLRADMTSSYIRTREELSQSNWPTPHNASHLWCLYDFGPEICLDDSRDGLIVRHIVTKLEPDEFLNSNVEVLMECLTAWQRIFGVNDWDTVDESFLRLAEAEKELRRIDPLAFSNAKNFWPWTIWDLRTNE